MSVFELSGLQKLRRIGLVRVHNLTDHAIYSLAERHATLERIHLSYCDQITVRAIHFLLQKLPKLTHLSLTGVPDFRRPELQKFCREAPSVCLSMTLCYVPFLIFVTAYIGVQYPTASCILRIFWYRRIRPP